MKEQIMTKLFNSQELTSEEILFVGKNLIGEGVTSILPFHHGDTNTMNACGITEKDFDNINAQMKANIVEKKSEINSISEYVEKFEQVATMSPQNLRVLIMNYIRMMQSSQNPLSALLKFLDHK